MDDERWFGTHIREVIQMGKDFIAMVKGDKPELCYHPGMTPTQWEQKKPEPAVMVGPCEHNMICPVCGYGRGCAPDPCDERLEEVDHGLD